MFNYNVKVISRLIWPTIFIISKTWICHNFDKTRIANIFSANFIMQKRVLMLSLFPTFFSSSLFHFSVLFSSFINLNLICLWGRSATADRWWYVTWWILLAEASQSNYHNLSFLTRQSITSFSYRPNTALKSSNLLQFYWKDIIVNFICRISMNKMKLEYFRKFSGQG